MTPAAHTRRHHDWGFLAIAGLKLVKGTILVGIGIGTLSLLDRNMMARMTNFAYSLQVDLHSRIAQKLLVKLGVAQKRDLVLITVTTFFYAALLLTEGVGLLLEKVWAEYMTFLVTASFIPIEVYELTRRVTAPRIAVLAVNSLVIAYLALRLHQRAMAKRRALAASTSTANRGETCAETGARSEQTPLPRS